MLSIIVEDTELCHGIFPGPGTAQEDRTSSNKQPKLDFEWTVACRLFEKHEQFTNVFVQTRTTPKGWVQWVTKIKNKLTQ